MKASALMVFLLLFLTSVLAHAEHLVLQETAIEQQDCQLCNKGIDTPPALLLIKAKSVTQYTNARAKEVTIEFALSYFIQPPSRAPPFFQ